MVQGGMEQTVLKRKHGVRGKAQPELWVQNAESEKLLQERGRAEAESQGPAKQGGQGLHSQGARESRPRSPKRKGIIQ